MLSGVCLQMGVWELLYWVFAGNAVVCSILWSLRLSHHRVTISPISFPSLALLGQLAVTSQLVFLISWNRVGECFWSCGPKVNFSHLCGLMGSVCMMKHPTFFALKIQTCPEKSSIYFCPQGGRGRNTHLPWEQLDEQYFLSSQLHNSYRWMECMSKEHSIQNASSKDGSVGLLLQSMGLQRMGGFLPVSGLSDVLVAQWAEEAFTLFPLRHQFSLVGLAHTISLTIADKCKFWTHTCRRVTCSSCLLSPFFPWFVLVRALHPFSFWICCSMSNLRQVSAASHSPVRRPGKLRTVLEGIAKAYTKPGRQKSCCEILY